MSLWKSVQVFAASFFKERAAALTSKAGLGQLWVKNDTPNVLVFTDDAGTDKILSDGDAEPSTAAGQILFGDATGGYDHTEVTEAKWDDTDKQIILRTGGGAARPTLAMGDGTCGFYSNSEGVIRFSSGGAGRFAFTATSLTSHISRSFDMLLTAASGTTPSYRFSGDTDTGVGSAGDDQLSLIAGGVEGIRITETGSAITAETFGDILGNVSKKITVSTATYGLNESSNYPEVILHVTRTATGTCVITIDTDMLSNDSQITIKDAGGGAASFNITVQTEGAENIDGAATAVISGNYDSITLYNDDSNWFIK